MIEAIRPVQSALKLLFVDDSEDDVFLLTQTLRGGGLLFEHQYVDNAVDLKRVLDASDWDVVITDHHMVGFSSSETLQIVHQQG